MKKIIENPKECNKCKEKIGWHQLKSGKWMPVTLKKDCSVVDDDGKQKYYFECNYGNHNGYTPRHRCPCSVCGISYSQNVMSELNGKIICLKCKEMN